MGNHSQSDLSWLKVTTDHKLPRHVVRLTISGDNTFQGFILSTIGESKLNPRNTLILPKRCLEIISDLPEIQKIWREFSARVLACKRLCRMKTAPALNKLAMEYKASGVLTPFNVTTVVFRYGAVPALVIGTIEGLQCAVLPILEDTQENADYTEDESLVVLKSLDLFFPTLCKAYCEQIAYYAHAIFFGAGNDVILNYCFKIRHLLDISLGTKLDVLYNPKGAAAKDLAVSIREKHVFQISTAKATQRIGDLIIKYIYACYGVDYSLVSNYRRTVIPSSDEDDDGADDFKNYLEKCEETFNNSGEVLLRELKARKESIPEWAFLLGQACRFIGEIRGLNKFKDDLLPVPRVFLGHHFTVKHSAFFHAAVTIRNTGRDVRIIRGRGLLNNIGWSMLALIWLSDRQLLFVPDSLDEDGATRNLKTSDDWVIKELLYGQYIGAHFLLVVSEKSPVRVQLRDQIMNYTDTCEIEQIDNALWLQFIKKAKSDLFDQFTKERYIEFPKPVKLSRPQDRTIKQRAITRLANARQSNGQDEIEAYGNVNFEKIINELTRSFGSAESNIVEELARMSDKFWERFSEDVFYKTAIAFIDNLFLAWSKVFLPEAWSVAQIMIEKTGLDGKVEIKLNDLVRQIKIKSESKDRRFGWACLETERRIETRVKGYIKQLNQQPLFSFGVPISLTLEVTPNYTTPEIVFTSRIKSIVNKFAANFPKEVVKEMHKVVRKTLHNPNVDRMRE